jgi:hypothetical protein
MSIPLVDLVILVSQSVVDEVVVENRGFAWSSAEFRGIHPKRTASCA